MKRTIDEKACETKRKTRRAPLEKNININRIDTVLWSKIQKHRTMWVRLDSLPINDQWSALQHKAVTLPGTFYTTGNDSTVYSKHKTSWKQGSDKNRLLRRWSKQKDCSKTKSKHDCLRKHRNCSSIQDAPIKEWNSCWHTKAAKTKFQTKTKPKSTKLFVAESPEANIEWLQISRFWTVQTICDSIDFNFQSNEIKENWLNRFCNQTFFHVRMNFISNETRYFDVNAIRLKSIWNDSRNLRIKFKTNRLCCNEMEEKRSKSFSSKTNRVLVFKMATRLTC